MTEFTSHEEYSYYSMVVSWIETNGYYLLISVILLTYLYRKGLEMYIHHEKRASLSEATQPDRVRLLNEKARQAREKQQAELERAAEEYKKKQEEKKEQLRKVQLGELIKKQGSGARSGTSRALTTHNSLK